MGKRPVKAPCMLARLGLCSRPVSGWIILGLQGRLGALLMAGVAQLVRAPVCGTGGRRFKTGHSPHFSSQLMGKTGIFGRPVKANERRWQKKQMTMCGRGGIGRRAGFRYQWRKSWGFESLRPHHLTARIFAASAAQVQGDRVTSNRVTPSVPVFRWGRYGQPIAWLRSVQIKPVWKNPIWLCRHVTNRPNNRSWQDKG